MLIVSINKFFLVALFSILFFNFAFINDAFLQSLIFFAVSLFVSLIILLKNYENLSNEIKFLSPLILIFFIGTLLSGNNEFQFALRDMYYFSNHILIIFFGFQLAKVFSLKKFITAFIWLVFATFLFFYFKLIYLNLSSSSYIEEYAYTAAYASLFPLAITVISIYRYLKMGFSNNFYFLIAILFFIHIIVIDSRTSLVSLAIYFTFAISILSKINLKSIIKFLMISGVFVIAFLTIGDILNAPMVDRFYDSFKEFNPNTRFNYMSDVNLYWRAYESYVSFLDYFNLPLTNQIIGAGFGKEVFLGFEVYLGESSFNKIYVFHNGYINLLLKTGLVGLLIYVYFFANKFFHYKKFNDLDSSKLIFTRLMLSLICILVLLVTIPIAGLMNISIFPIALVFGFMACKEKIYTEKSY